ncbi:hypothetical protein CRG98_031635 [Punica granatum]|uniref:Uncharacterized protein n=1 Tax=Punica granatum TaxID=22663 RepID=A0A2I0IVE1_PUNGR|nr:hypothetical protein CRG98_031635 [Punica granatum]
MRERAWALIGDPDPTTKVADTHRRRQKPRGWGRGRQSTASTPPPWSPTSSVGACNLDGGVGLLIDGLGPFPFIFFLNFRIKLKKS